MGAAPTLPGDPSVLIPRPRGGRAPGTRLCLGVPLRRPIGDSRRDLAPRVARPLGSRCLDPLPISLVGNVQSRPGSCLSTSAPPSPAQVPPRKAAVGAHPLCPRVVAFSGLARGGVRQPLG